MYFGYFQCTERLIELIWRQAKEASGLSTREFKRMIERKNKKEVKK
jgi:hypothetical protein